MKTKQYNVMTTPDLEEALSELKNELTLAVGDEVRESELEDEIERVERILEEREEVEAEIDAAVEAENEL